MDSICDIKLVILFKIFEFPNLQCININQKRFIIKSFGRL